MTQAVHEPDGIPPRQPMGAGDCEPLWDKQRLADFCGICLKSVTKLVRCGQLPKPVIKSGRVMRWRAEDVRNHLARKARMG